MDHGGEALIGLVGTHCDAFELLEPAEEVLDEMPPFVHLVVDGERLRTARMLGDDDLGANAFRKISTPSIGTLSRTRCFCWPW